MKVNTYMELRFQDIFIHSFLHQRISRLHTVKE